MLKGRLKSLHSVWKKMQRKKASLAEVYDARALRIVVGDENGKRHKVSHLSFHTCRIIYYLKSVSGILKASPGPQCELDLEE